MAIAILSGISLGIANPMGSQPMGLLPNPGFLPITQDWQPN